MTIKKKNAFSFLREVESVHNDERGSKLLNVVIMRVAQGVII
jgi:hypothetical protein